MTARDEAIEAMQQALSCDRGRRWSDLVAHLLGAIPPDVLVRYAIERGGLIESGVWDRAPSDHDRVNVYYEDESRPDDAVVLYRLAEMVES